MDGVDTFVQLADTFEYPFGTFDDRIVFQAGQASSLLDCSQDIREAELQLCIVGGVPLIGHGVNLVVSEDLKKRI